MVLCPPISSMDNPPLAKSKDTGQERAIVASKGEKEILYKYILSSSKSKANEPPMGKGPYFLYKPY